MTPILLPLESMIITGPEVASFRVSDTGISFWIAAAVGGGWKDGAVGFNPAEGGTFATVHDAYDAKESAGFGSGGRTVVSFAHREHSRP